MYEEALRAFEKNGTDENRIALKNAQERRDISKREAEKQFEDQKKASIQAAKLSAGVAIMNALATPPWYVGVALAAAAAYRSRETIKGIESTQFSGGGSVSAGSGGGSTASTATDSPQAQAQQRPQTIRETIYVMDASLTSPEQAKARHAQMQKELYRDGIIYEDENGTNFDNVQERVITR